MRERALSLILVAAGLVVLVVSAFAEPLGLGNDDGFGSKQVAGMDVGGIVVAAGLVLMYLRRGGVASAPSE